MSGCRPPISMPRQQAPIRTSWQRAYLSRCSLVGKQHQSAPAVQLPSSAGTRPVLQKTRVLVSGHPGVAQAKNLQSTVAILSQASRPSASRNSSGSKPLAEFTRKGNHSLVRRLSIVSAVGKDSGCCQEPQSTGSPHIAALEASLPHTSQLILTVRTSSIQMEPRRSKSQQQSKFQHSIIRPGSLPA